MPYKMNKRDSLNKPNRAIPAQVQPIVKCLPSGWTLIRFSKECFAQVPPGWKAGIPDEFIFNPEWNRDRINNWFLKEE